MAAESTEQEFADTPQGWSSRWQMELKTAREALKDFYAVADEVEASLRDEKQDDRARRLCLFPSSNQTVGAMLFGRMPQASVGRKFADANDDTARVAAEMLERVLNCDIERADDTFAESVKNSMTDWLGPGLGVNWHRYEVGPEETTPEVPAKVDQMTGAELAPMVPATSKKSWERVNTDYVYFKDFLWSQGGRTWSDVSWVARCAKLGRKALVERFGKIGEVVPLNAKKNKEGSENKDHPWDRADVWEVWHKDTKRVYWVVEGFHQTLDIKDDPLGLEGFFPCQRPLMSNVTTTKLIPVADYKYAQDLYRSVDVLTTRIALLTKAVRVAGAYDKELTSTVEKLVDGGENKLYPVDAFAALAEKGGIAGAIVWLPLDQIVATLATLRDLRREEIDLIYQVTGQSDIMRGQQTANGTPGEAQVKAKFGSVRIQAKQDEIARFASDGQRIRAEIISRHFDPQTIIDHSNILQTPDAPMAMQAAELIKSRLADYRVEIKPEAINLTDFAALKEERFEVLAGISSYFQAMAPVVQAMPQSLPFMLQMLQVTVSGLKGGSAYEAILDQAIAKAEAAAEAAAANPQQAPPDPKVLVQGMKAQHEMQKIQAETQASLTQLQAEVQADAVRESNQRQQNVLEHQQKQLISNALRPKQAPGNGGMPR